MYVLDFIYIFKTWPSIFKSSEADFANIWYFDYNTGLFPL